MTAPNAGPLRLAGPFPHRGVLVVEPADEDFDALARAAVRSPQDPRLWRARSAAEALEVLRAAQSSGEPPLIALESFGHKPARGSSLLSLKGLNLFPSSIPVIVMSASTRPRDVEAAYRIGAAGYVVRQANYGRFERAVHTLLAYWFGAMALPRGDLLNDSSSA